MAAGRQFLHLAPDRLRIPRLQRQPGPQNQTGSVRKTAVPIAKTALRHILHSALGGQAGNALHHLRHFAPISASVHGHRTAQRTWDSVGKFQPCQAPIPCKHSKAGQRDSAACQNILSLQPALFQPRDGFHNKPLNSFVSHQQIRAVSHKKGFDLQLRRRFYCGSSLLHSVGKRHQSRRASNMKGCMPGHGLLNTKLQRRATTGKLLPQVNKLIHI